MAIFKILCLLFTLSCPGNKIRFWVFTGGSSPTGCSVRSRQVVVLYSFIRRGKRAITEAFDKVWLKED